MLEIFTHQETTKAFVLDAEDNLLVVRRSLLAWRGRGRYDLPGGGIRRGEAAAEALAREIKEEICLNIEPDGLQRLCGSATCSFLVGYIDEVKPDIRTNWESYSPAWPYVEDAVHYLHYPAQAEALGVLIASGLRRRPSSAAIELPQQYNPSLLEQRTAS